VDNVARRRNWSATQHLRNRSMRSVIQPRRIHSRSVLARHILNRQITAGHLVTLRITDARCGVSMSSASDQAPSRAQRRGRSDAVADKASGKL